MLPNALPCQMPDAVCLILPSFVAPNASCKCPVSRDDAPTFPPPNSGLRVEISVSGSVNALTPGPRKDTQASASKGLRPLLETLSCWKVQPPAAPPMGF